MSARPLKHWTLLVLAFLAAAALSLPVEAGEAERASPSLSAADRSLLAAYKSAEAEAWDTCTAHLAAIPVSETRGIPSPQGLSPFLEPLYLWVKAGLLTQKDLDSEAERLFARLSGDPANPFAEAAALAHLRLLKKVENWAGVADLLATLKRRLPTAFSPEEWDFELAMTDLNLGRGESAFRLLKKLFITAPQFEGASAVRIALSGIAARKRQAFERLLSDGEWWTRFETALDRGAIAQAEESLAALHANTPESVALAFAKAKFAYKARRYGEAKTLFDAYLAAHPGNGNTLEALAMRASSAARSGAVDEALALNESIAANYPHSNSAHWARYKIAFLKMDTQRNAEALADFDALARSGFKPTLAQSLWYAGLAAYHLKRYDEARTQWARLAARVPKEKSRAAYWQARTLLDEGRRAEAKAQFDALAQTARLDYYGFLALFAQSGASPDWKTLPPARYWLNALPKNIEEWPLAWPSDAAPSPEALSLAMRYAYLGIDAAFPHLFDRAKIAVLAARPANAGMRLRLLSIALHTGEYAEAQGLAGKSKTDIGNAFPDLADTFSQFSYPRAWPQFAQEYAAAFGVPEYAIYAIMRQESGFRPAVRSPANAIGLMQLIPPTAETVAAELRDADFTLNRLKDPKTNIRMGTYYFGSLLTRFQGALPLAVAAYNAGPEAVERWAQAATLTANQWEEFVEAIPYAETNTYVKRVLTNYWVYQRLYGQE